MLWHTTRFTIDLAQRPRVMGIVNCTPDSFSDGGASTATVMERCERLVREGADMLDLGAESTRPGAASVTADEELARLLPVLEVALQLGVPVSVDTSEPIVMREALERGVDIINDVRALRRPGALEALVAHGRAGCCLMHMRGEPATMQLMTDYADVVVDVREFLVRRLADAVEAGIAADRVVLDPGIGFAKKSQHNLELLARQRELTTLGRPLLVGWSRKGTLGQVTERPLWNRQTASVAAALLAVDRGASIVRVHDVAATVDAIKVWRAATIARPSLARDEGQAEDGGTIAQEASQR